MDVWLLYGHVQVQAPSPFSTREQLKQDHYRVTVFTSVDDGSVIELYQTGAPVNPSCTIAEIRAWIAARDTPPVDTLAPPPDAPTQIEGED